MSGNKAILDSNLLIFLSKEMIDRKKLYAKYDEFCVSLITYMEVYAFEFSNKNEKDSLDKTFANLEINRNQQRNCRPSHHLSQK